MSVTGFSDSKKKSAIRERFDHLAWNREYWQRKGSYYYHDQQRYMRFLIPEGLRVLEIGCGLGDLLAAVKPSRGVGVDLSDMMVKEASRRHPSLESHLADCEALDLDETFDVMGHLLYTEATLRRLRAFLIQLGSH